MTGLLSFLGWAIINVINLTLRVSLANPFAVGKKRAVYAFWHGEQFLLNIRHKGTGAVIMSSLSRDGGIQAGILRRFGYAIVRGSSTRGGERALVEMIRLVKKGRDAGFAVDGPKGPYKKAKPGVVLVAMKSGIPLVPISCAAERTHVFPKAWDKYELPRLFSRCAAVYGNPISVLKDDDVERKTEELDRSLNAISEFSHGAFWSKDIQEYLAAHPAPRILIVQPSRIGDLVFASPAVHAIRKKYPRAAISWIVDERCAPVLEGNKDIDEMIILDRRKISPAYLYKMRRDLRERHFDLSIDFHGLAKSAFIVALAGARFRLASSSTNGMRELSSLFSKEIKPKTDNTHCVDRHFAVAEYLGCSAADKVFTLEPGEAAIASARKLLEEKGLDLSKPFAVIHPGGGWLSRRWFPERFSALIDRLSQLGVRSVLVGGREGGAGEKGLNEEILSGSKAGALDLTGALTLKELIAVIKTASVFIANEAGPMHIATALGAPAVAILGPTDAGRTGPYVGKTTVIQHKIECQPCRERSCIKKTCMELVTVDEVFEATKKALV